MRGGLMVCGTASDVGKSRLVTGLCRLLAREGVRVAPFKAQNMALNSYVTAEGAEIGRAQGVQALAAGAEPEAAMNPVLLKPTGERRSQVVLRGRPLGTYSAVEYHELKERLFAEVLDCLADLRSRFDVVLLEGAGSPAEINLLDHDIVNLRVATAARLPAVVVGDIDRGGVFAALYGTVALLPEELRDRVKGFVLNKFRGDPALLEPAYDQMLDRCGVPVLGVVPHLAGLGLDAEDSLALSRPFTHAAASGVDALDVAAVRLPHISNFTDLDALALEPGAHVRLVDHPAALGQPDLIVLPGTKATVADLDWLRATGLAEAVSARHAEGSVVLGVCGGYQMLGTTIHDEVESTRGTVAGLGLLDVDTKFEAAKTTRQRTGTALGRPVAGYEIHHGVVAAAAGSAWLTLDRPDGPGGEPEGATGERVWGTTLHGLFESDGLRGEFLARVAEARRRTFAPSDVSFAAARTAQFDMLADAVAAGLDMQAVRRLIAEGAPA